MQSEVLRQHARFTKTLRIMKFATVVLFAFGLHVSAKSVSQTVTLSGKALPLKRVFADIKKQTGALFFYRNEDLEGTTPVSIQLKAVPLQAALEALLKEQPLSFTIQGNTIFIIRKSPPLPTSPPDQLERTDTAVAIDITGRIINEEGEPLPGANIIVKGTTKGIGSDDKGEFRLTDVPANATLLISNIGYETKKVRVNGGKEILATLIRSENKLDQFQVIAYGTTTRGKLTSPISSVKAKDIRNLPLSSFDQMLQGLASGVFVNANSGAPGKQPSVTIRGRNSINGGDPLYIIDGTPIISGALGPAGDQLNPLTGIDPGDIASIDILKDAGSTAIYGSRAANGVILITTKRGREGKTLFNANVIQGAGIPTGRLHLLQTADYLRLRREAFTNDNPGQPLPQDLAKVDSLTNTDWQDLVYKPTTIGEYKINMSGGNNLTQYYMSGGYRKETNPLSGKKGLERGTFRLNLDHKASSRLNISASIGVSRDVNQNTSDASVSYSAVDAAILAPPNLKPYDSAGNFTVVPLPFAVGNPLALFQSKMNNTTTQLKTSVNLHYAIWNGLAFHTDLGYDYNSLVAKIYYPKAVNAILQNPLYDARLFNNQTNTYSIEPQLRYAKVWNKVHTIDAVAGTTFQKTTTNIGSIYGKGFASDDLQELSAAATTYGSSATNVYAFTSMFGRVNYNYLTKYIVNASFRRDGSSRFGPGNRFGNFWSVSGAWLFSRESFGRNLSFLSLGKLRSSYGIVGNDAIGDYAYLDQWQPYAYGGQPGSRPTTAENPNVEWERTAKFDIGLDLGFIHDRFGVVVNYFDNRTNNLLVTRTLPSQSGFTSVVANLPAVVRNSGWEVELNSVNFRTTDFQWTTKLNVTTQKNALRSFPDLANTSFYNLNYKIGEPLSLLWGYKFLGVDPATGTPVYDGYNLDGTAKNTTDPNPGRQIIGRFSADYYGGIVNNFSWKGFALDVFLQFVHGVDVYNNHTQLNNSSAFVSNQEAAVLQRWTKPGDITQVPRSATPATAWWVNTGIDALSSRFVSDGSYWRIKNVTFSYSLPASILSGMKIKELRLYATAQNLATFTHYKGIDPETGANVAPVRMIVGGINLAF